MKRFLFETDWLASWPVFYNERTARASHNVNDVIDFENIEFDPEGFNNYLDFGYSVFEQTPVKHVKFLRYSSRLTVHDDGRLEVQYLDDPAEQWIGRAADEDDVLHRLETSIRRWEKSVDGEIIIPTSGGYDSRLLNFFIKDKSRIRSFTYGLSDRQVESFEVVYAKKLSEILGTRWEQIELGGFHRYFNEWDQLFGVSTHAHGMYHIEFYTNILPKVSGGNPFLSGIIGDVLSGNWSIPEIQTPGDVVQLGKTHGLHADSDMGVLARSNALNGRYFEANRDRLRDWRMRIVEAARFKIILLSYLMIVPRSFGLQPWSPFLDIEVAAAMLNLSGDRRKDRVWQRDFFQKNGIDLESMGLKANRQNTLDQQGIRRIPVPPLSTKLLREVVNTRYVDWINSCVGQQGRFWDWFWNLTARPHASRLLRPFGIRDCRLDAYSAYVTLKPIETLLMKRNAVRAGSHCELIPS